MVAWLRRLFSPSPPVHPPAGSAAVADEAGAPADTGPADTLAPLTGTQTASGGQPSMLSAMQRADVNANFTNWLFDDRGEDESFTNPLEDRILASLNEILNSKQSGAALVRRMPGVIPQLLQRLRSDDFSGHELARMISHDVVLVAGVVRLANSAMYNRNRHIASIEQAILVLGQAGLRQLITSVAFQPILDLNSGTWTRTVAPRLWDQSEKCAIANRLLAERGDTASFDAFLAGLAQNVGLIASLRLVDQMAGEDDVIGSESFCHALMRCTRGLSCSIAREWRFPAPVAAAIEEAGGNRKFTELSPMGRTLVMGDYLSKVDLLLRHNRLNPDDPRLLKGLSPHEADCLRQLQAMPEREDPAGP